MQQLDGFISWLQEALDSTENWTQPRLDLDSLRGYLDTHLVRAHPYPDIRLLPATLNIRLTLILTLTLTAKCISLCMNQTSAETFMFTAST